MYTLAARPRISNVVHTCEKPNATSLFRMERTKLNSAETKAGSAMRSIGYVA
jgi:hypothetical protein